MIHMYIIMYHMGMFLDCVFVCFCSGAGNTVYFVYLMTLACVFYI